MSERERRQSAARDKVRKLMAVYNRHPDTPEGRTAKAKADELTKQYGLDAPSGDPFLDRLQREANKRREAERRDNRPPPGSYFGAFADMFNRNFPGRDDEDYSKYAKGRRVVDKEDD